MSKLSRAFELSQQVSIAANEEASRWGQPQIDIDHVFLALLVTGGRAGHILRGQDVSLDEARTAVQALHAEQVASLGISVPEMEPVPIADPSIGNIDWSPRGLAVMRDSSDYSDDLDLLVALIDEPSGFISAVLKRLRLDPNEVRRAVGEARATPDTDRVADPGNSGWCSVSNTGFIPASLAQVWALLADVSRRPEWDSCVGRVERVDAESWDLWVATRRSDGKPVRIRRDFRRSRIRQIAIEPQHRVVWEITQPDRGRRTITQRFAVTLAETTGGTSIDSSFQWRRTGGWRGIAQRPLAPLYRFVMRQRLFATVGGISRTFR
ncbi:Clp protease N-terminal domain-containing protein [Saxibacter everestensis]|uniref:Clp protease N-terminal domain-containing protein n=1 Tax=Saxibacter everestensis TaxID=2909229 RepID=A0ABY8QY05_9MICO|nr:Clp protease N-terminal domain-containing protein [Brevibacteriaceae bacterium ZFBP1038]